MKRMVMVMLGVLAVCANIRAASVTNVRGMQREEGNFVDIYYDLDAAEGETFEVEVGIEGQNEPVKVSRVKGAVGKGISPGKDLHVEWDAGADWAGKNGQLKAVVTATKEIPEQERRYMIIDISKGRGATSYPVKYVDNIPSGVLTTEYKTTKLVLRRIEADEPFFCGIFEVTQKQYTLVTGHNPSTFIGDTRPVENISWNDIRGDANIYDWPKVKTVDLWSFIGLLRSKTGCNFDLPSIMQSEYACRAGTTTTYSYGNSENGSYMWYADNAYLKGLKTQEVGTRLPNQWGLYDMHGSVEEWCLDSPVTGYRTIRDCAWCTTGVGSSFWSIQLPSSRKSALGFRIFMSVSNQ